VFVVYTYERVVVVMPVTIQIKYKIEYDQTWSIGGDQQPTTHIPLTKRRLCLLASCHFSAQVFKDTIIGGYCILFTYKYSWSSRRCPNARRSYLPLSRPTVIVLCNMMQRVLLSMNVEKEMAKVEGSSLI